nr:immunoglobulin light chain junction region [Macaca mulatta]
DYYCSSYTGGNTWAF